MAETIAKAAELEVDNLTFHVPYTYIIYYEFLGKTIAAKVKFCNHSFTASKPGNQPAYPSAVNH